MARFFSFPTLPEVASPADRAPSTLVSRNVTVAGHRTSVRLEPAMWGALREICEREHASLNDIVTEVGTGRSQSSLTAAIRVSVLSYFQAAVTEDGHRCAGHGALTSPPSAPAARYEAPVAAEVERAAQPPV
jgi:predicted DNA-binding ribbon-helix-helix protein